MYEFNEVKRAKRTPKEVREQWIDKFCSKNLTVVQFIHKYETKFPPIRNLHNWITRDNKEYYIRASSTRKSPKGATIPFPESSKIDRKVEKIQEILEKALEDIKALR
jgi:hypothetical protein